MNNVGLLAAMLIAPRLLDTFGFARVIVASGSIVVAVGLAGLWRLAQTVPQPAVAVL
jgi:hypothetical protein